MGKQNIDYSLTKIYSIEPITEHPAEHIYYGSTTNKYLSTRIAAHRYNYLKWLNSKEIFCSVFILLKKYGLENCKIDLVESFPCSSKDEKSSREGYYIRNNGCINKNIAGRTQKEYQKQYKSTPEYKDYIKQYQLKPEYKNYQKQYQANYYQKKKQERETTKNNITYDADLDVDINDESTPI